MNSVGIGDFRRANNRRDIQIAPRAFGRPDADRLVGETNVRTIAVRLGVHGNRLNSQFFAGANDANSYLAAIGNEDLVKPYGRQTEPPRTPQAARS